MSQSFGTVTVVDPVTVWLLGSIVAPDAYTRLVNIIASRPHCRRLEAEVRRDTGIRPGFRYRRWLRKEQTWADLVARRKEAYERLVDSLVSAEAQGIIRRRSENRERATKLVNSTIGYFLPTLDPSLATAVADFRAERRHEQVLARLDASTSFKQRLEMLPPAAREVLEHEHVHRGLRARQAGRAI